MYSSTLLPLFVHTPRDRAHIELLANQLLSARVPFARLVPVLYKLINNYNNLNQFYLLTYIGYCINNQILYVDGSTEDTFFT